jgi:hypothetical protein
VRGCGRRPLGVGTISGTVTRYLFGLAARKLVRHRHFSQYGRNCLLGFQDRCLKPLGHPSKRLIFLDSRPTSETTETGMLPRIATKTIHLTPKPRVIAYRNEASSRAAASTASIISAMRLLIRPPHRPLNNDRERERKSRALTGLRVEPDLAPVHLNDAFRYGKSQAGAALLARDGIVGLLELPKQLGLIGGGYARTCVTNRYMERAILRFGLNGDFARVGELNRIADRTDEDLRQAAAIATAGRQLRNDLNFEPKLFVGCQRLERAADGQ